MPADPGTLHLVGTPIGNLEDITLRALRVLREVDLIAAEDTRVTRKLLSHYEIHVPMVSLHRHNERQRTHEILQHLASGQRVALVTDAGMPGVSDPGRRLAAQAVRAGFPVQVVPGPSAVLAALTAAALETDRFAFEGFLPRKGVQRRERLEQMAAMPHTLVLFEASGRLVQTLRDLQGALGPRRAAVVRELTKRFEEVVRGDWDALLDHFTQRPPRGELVVVVEGVSRPDRAVWNDRHVSGELERMLEQGIDRRDAIRLVTSLSGRPRREVYSLALQLRGPSGPGRERL